MIIEGVVPVAHYTLYIHCILAIDSIPVGICEFAVREEMIGAGRESE